MVSGRTVRMVATAVATLAMACGPGGGGDTESASMAPDELASRIEAGNAPLVLDVRTPEEYRRGHIPGALNIPQDELADRLGELPIDASEEVVVHCQRGGRAAVAEATLREHGYENVVDLEGHFGAWDAAELPVEREAP